MRKSTGIAGWLAGLQLLGSAAAAQQGAPSEEPSKEACADLAGILVEAGGRLKKDFQIDPRVRGCVRGEVDVSAMSYRDLQAMLALHGFVDVMEQDGIIQVVPDGGARQQPLRLIDERTRDVGEFEMVMKLVDVTPLNAAQLVPILRPLLSQYSHLVAHSQTNTMVIVSRYASVRTLENLLRALKARPLAPAAAADQSEEAGRGVEPPR